MKKRLGAILPVIVLVLALGATGVFAAVTFVTGDMVFLSPPPASVVDGALESSDEVYVFNERQNVRLSSSLLTDDSETIPAGKFVNSHLVHFDPVGSSSSPVVSVSGSVNFDGEILGLFTTNEGLGNTDGTFGLAGTAYPTSSGRHLEESGGNADTAIVCGSNLAVDLHATSGIDQVRVITAGAQPAWVGGEAQSVHKIEIVWQWIKGTLLQIFGLNSSA